MDTNSEEGAKKMSGVVIIAPPPFEFLVLRLIGIYIYIIGANQKTYSQRQIIGGGGGVGHFSNVDKRDVSINGWGFNTTEQSNSIKKGFQTSIS